MVYFVNWIKGFLSDKEQCVVLFMFADHTKLLRPIHTIGNHDHL